MAALDNAVDADALARLDQHEVARRDRGDRQGRRRAVGHQPCRRFGLERGEVAGEVAGAPAHHLVEIPADQQEEDQHRRAVEIGVLGVVGGLDDRHAERQHDSQRDRHVHVDRAGPQGPQRALEEGASGIGGRGQRDQGREPVEEVARDRADVAALARPDRDRQQHDVHGGKARHGEVAKQPPLLQRDAVALRRGQEWIGLEAQRGEFLDHALGPQRALGPFDRDPLQGEVDARLQDRGVPAEPALDRMHAAGAADALHRQLHACDTAFAVADKDREILLRGHARFSPSARRGCARRRRCPRPARPERPASSRRCEPPGWWRCSRQLRLR